MIGVARDTIAGLVFGGADPLMYLPLSPGNPYGKYLLARTQTDASRVMGAVRAEIAALNPEATLSCWLI